MDAVLNIDGRDRVIILLLLGDQEGSDFIKETMMNHHVLSCSEFEKRLKDSLRRNPNSEYYSTSISRKIKHPNIPFNMRVVTYASRWIGRQESMTITLKIEGLSEYGFRCDLKTLLDREIRKHILGE